MSTCLEYYGLLHDFRSAAHQYLEGSEVEDYTEVSSDLEDDVTWIEWFCTVKGHEYFVEIDEDYIRDDFNLTGNQRKHHQWHPAID